MLEFKDAWGPMFNLFLATPDADRAFNTFEVLSRHATGGWTLTGGLAVEIHLLQAGEIPARRRLNDIDFIVDQFDAIPASLPSDLIFRHVHPNDAENRTLMQAVFPPTAVRIDIFRSTAAVIRRAHVSHPVRNFFRLISLEDLTARCARLSLDLAEGQTTPAKHVRDLIRLLPLVDGNAMESVWPDHRKPKHPASFGKAAELLQQLIPAHPDLQTVPTYSHDFESRCPRCHSMSAFPLADAKRVHALLGYC